jgi:hypothetical protein
MAILPVDLQALLLRLNDANKPHQREAEGALLTQMTKAEEVAKQAQVESSRVNEVKPHPDLNNKIEPDGKGKQRSSGGGSGRGSGGKPGETSRNAARDTGAAKQARGERRGGGKPGEQPTRIEHPYMGKIIDTKI